MKKSFRQIVETYKLRYKHEEEIINEAVDPNTNIIIVIPCHNEPDITTTLSSLHQSVGNKNCIELIIVLNASEVAAKSVIDQNKKIKNQISQWKKDQPDHAFDIHIIERNQLPKKHAGVGLARKTGMDEALFRLASIEKNGLIVCLDADCEVSENYVDVLHQYWLSTADREAAYSIHYEHPYDDLDAVQMRAVVEYELFLRYYIQALKQVNYPYAFHTIGSSMGVKASTYAQQGGMNKRKAGEDFYFLHKMTRICNIDEITDASVFPAGRPSDRVPFGTGKAIKDYLAENTSELLTYDWRCFQSMEKMITTAERLYQLDEKQAQAYIDQNFPELLSGFLYENKVLYHLEEMNQHANSKANFVKRFFQWFDGFKVLKYIHFATDMQFPKIPVTHACSQLLEAKNLETGVDQFELLNIFRNLDRYGTAEATN